MRRVRPLAVSLMVASCGPVTQASAPSPAGSAASAIEAPPASTFVAGFADPDRRKKLEAALPKIDAIIEAEMKAEEIPSVVVGIVIDGELAYSKGFGFADVASGRKADVDTVYRVASMSKSFAALTVLRLRDEGKLSLDDALSKHLPEAARITPASADSPPITLRHLLAHTSGLPRDGTYDGASKEVTDTELIAALGKTRAERAPGLGFAYSNLGYTALAVAAGRAAGTPYRKAVLARILGPLGMRASTFDVAEVPPARLATAYVRRGPGTLVPIDPWTFRAGEGAGGLYTSLRDLARYAALQLSAYPPRGGADDGPVKRSTVREAHEPRARAQPLRVWTREAPEPGQRPVGARASAYGYGWFVKETCEFDDLVMHGGLVDGYSTQLALLPERGVAAIVLTNARHAEAEWLAEEALLLLKRSGGLEKRSADLRLASEFEPSLRRFLALMARWDDDSYGAMLSTGRPRVPAEKEELAGYRELHGACTAFSPLALVSAREGRFDVQCEKGRFELSLTLGIDGRVTGFDGTSHGVAAPPGLAEAAARIAGLVTKWDDRVYEKHLAKHEKDRAKLVARFERIRRAHGACTAKEFRRTPSSKSFRLSCERSGGLVLSVELDPSNAELVKSHTLRPGVEGACPSF